jgi:hypothetical protein
VSNPEIQKFKVNGNISIWHYIPESHRSFPGFHITADLDGSNSFVTLLEMAKSAKWPCKKSFQLSPLKDQIIKFPGSDKAFTQINTLILKYSKDSPKDLWALNANSDVATLDFGIDYLDELSKGITGIHHNINDYSIGNNKCLWFW